jgi:hypothetical protein
MRSDWRSFTMLQSSLATQDPGSPGLLWLDGTRAFLSRMNANEAG